MLRWPSEKAYTPAASEILNKTNDAAVSIVSSFALSSALSLPPQLPIPQLPGGFFSAEALRALDVFDDLIAPACHRVIVGEPSQAPNDLAL